VSPRVFHLHVCRSTWTSRAALASRLPRGASPARRLRLLPPVVRINRDGPLELRGGGASRSDARLVGPWVRIPDPPPSPRRHGRPSDRPHMSLRPPVDSAPPSWTSRGPRHAAEVSRVPPGASRLPPPNADKSPPCYAGTFSSAALHRRPASPRSAGTLSWCGSALLAALLRRRLVVKLWSCAAVEL